MSNYKSTILITGGTAGLGYHTAKSIAKQCPDRLVVVASRNNTDNASASLNAALGQKNVEYMPLDLSDPERIRSFAEDYRQRAYPPISALMLNAGLQFPGKVDFYPTGIERTFAVNHVGGSLLFFLLMPHLADNARIILTSSGTHDPEAGTGMPGPEYTTPENAARPNPAKVTKDGRVRYTTSKLCNIMWTYALGRRITEHGKHWTVNAVDPGFVPETGLARDYPPLLRFVAQKVLPNILPLLRLLMRTNNIYTAKQASAFLAELAVGDEVAGVNGKYFSEKKTISSSKESYDKGKQEDLWSWTIKELAKDEQERQRFERLEA
ncbi:uncharacterized protein HMPREF1541_05624 [Cyphellophora europaea CBS 101466]|uniref:Uncharacterized protein n=1 Tax=Cyphellophora europaea (strain CBS 101466) TaxID=1220924 RepID=W2RSD3_CYPE1|nr:uncharacterized protein HMPREF1541_05624 [Cyphellophora europaea CBS 101466]ETN39401.1 hypothetical protein HMPREF1541_05624 [Cyphellophora europaea CBS 101466]